jgi:hypothetical protein
MKVTYLDDSDEVVTFCYMVGGDQDHNEWSSPETQTMDRPTYWATKSNNSTDTACQMAAALASASMALKEVDADYASECLKYANALQKFGSTYVNACYDGVGSYYSSGSQKDDIAWGDLWCNIANGTIDSYSPIVPQDGVYNGEYDYWVYSWDKLWGGYSTLLSQLGFGSSFTNEVKFEMDKLNSNYSQAYYPIGGGWGASRYNCAWQMYAMEYASATGNDQYYTYAKSQMDYLLGNNSQGRSYLLGYTDTYPVNIHHRAANPNKSSATYTLYGALVGGPTDANGSYDDNTDSYSCTEPALDYNGSFIMAIAGLYDKYSLGEGTDQLDSIISSASEINEDYIFGAWYDSSTTVDSPTVTTTEEQPEVTTTEEEETTTTSDSSETILEATGSVYSAEGNTLILNVMGDDGQYSEVTFYLDNLNDDAKNIFEVGAEVELSYVEGSNSAISYTVLNPPTTTTYTETAVTTTVYTETETDVTTTTEDTTGSTSTILKGDANDDGSIEANDLLLVKKYVLQMIDSSAINTTNADVNGDNEVTSVDILQIKKYLLQMIDSLE